MTADWFQRESKRRKWLVGVSGGADSVALLHLLPDHGFRNLVVCHLDHRLRGRASAGDARFVARLAEKLGFPCESGRVEVARLAAAARQSIETAARHARHAFFKECAVKHRCPRVLLAHHADDQAETLLWNLLRGSHGLKGMAPAQTIGGLEFHRPLLSHRHESLCGYLTGRGLEWREDATNREPVAVRNRLRNEALPLLAEISGRDPAAALTRLAVDWQDQREITEWALEQAQVRDPQGRLHVPALKTLPPPLRREAVAIYFSEHSIVPERELLQKAVELLESHEIAVINLPGGRRFRRREGRAFVE